MSHPVPPQAQAAVEQLRQALRSVEGREIDPLSAPWEEIERALIKVLGGAFDARQPVHQSVALMVASALAGRLARDLDAFWFPHRGTMEGAALGFPDALVVLSPVEVAIQALSRARLAMLDEVAGELKGVITRARAQALLGPSGGGQQRLGPEDLQRLFDPGFVQLLCVDRRKAAAAWESTPSALARDIEGAFERLPANMPRELKADLREQLVGSLRRLESDKPIAEQVARAPQLVELLALLHGTVEHTGFAPAELWQELVMPLLHIGAAETFPPVDEDEIEALKSGADPALLYVDTLPYRTPAADEDGLLGVFPPEEVELLDGCFEAVPPNALRVLVIPAAPVAALVSGFDAGKVRDAVDRFRAYLAEKTGPEPPPASQTSLLPIAARLLDDVARVITAVTEGKGVLCLRRAPEAEAASEGAIAELRRALQGPRIILAP